MTVEPGYGTEDAMGVDRYAVTVTAEALDLADVRFTEHLSLLAYWEALRGKRVGPSRRDLCPCDFKAVLPRVALVELVEDAGDFRFRLAGTGLYRLNHKELTGHCTGALWPSAYADVVKQHYEMVVRTGQPNAFKIVFQTAGGLACRYTTLRLPLSSDGERVDGIMTLDRFCAQWSDVLSFLQQSNRPPSWKVP